MFKNQNILVTGAAGLLGMKLLSILSKNNIVHAIVRSEPQNKIEGVVYHIIDLSGTYLFKKLPTGINIIIHLAQSAKYRDFPESASDIFSVNLSSVSILLDYAFKTGVNQFLYASSGGIYDLKNNSPLSEDSSVTLRSDRDYYTSTKLCGEMLVNCYAKYFTVKILRIFFMYGKAQNREMLIPRLINNIKKGLPIVMRGEEGIQINPIHVDDAANAVVKIIDHSGSLTINIAGGEIISLKSLCDMLGDKMGIMPQYKYISSNQKSLVADISKLITLFYKPQVKLFDGLNDLI